LRAGSASPATSERQHGIGSRRVYSLTRGWKSRSGRGRVVRVSAVYDDEQLSDSLRDRVRNPFEAFSLGPRIAIGGALDLLEIISDPPLLQRRMDKVKLFVEDPRSVEEKATVAARKVEQKLTMAVDKGKAVESMALQSLQTSLQSLMPADLQDKLTKLLPADLAADLAKPPRSPPPPVAATSPPTASRKSVKPMLEGDPKYSLAKNIEESRARSASKAPDPDMSDADRAEAQTAAEVERLRLEVGRLRAALVEYAALKEEGAPGKVKMAALNLRERRDALRRIIRESRLGTNAAGSALAAAVKQAEELAADVAKLQIE